MRKRPLTAQVFISARPNTLFLVVSTKYTGIENMYLKAFYFICSTELVQYLDMTKNWHRSIVKKKMKYA